MTTEIEKQFFDTFGIEKIIPCYKCNMQNTNWDCKRTCLYDDEKRKEYPTITDRILLELICILSQHYCWGEENWFIERTTIGELKEWLLEEFIEIDKISLSKIIKHQVQALFEEG